MRFKLLLASGITVIFAFPLFLGVVSLNDHSGEHAREQYAQHLAAMSELAKQHILTAIDRIQDTTSLIASQTQMRHSLSDWNATGNTVHKDNVTQIIIDAKHGLSSIKDILIYDSAGRLVTKTNSVFASNQLDLLRLRKPHVTLYQGGNGDMVAASLKPLILDHAVVGYVEIQFFSHFISQLVKDRTGLGETGEWLFALRHEDGDALFVTPLKYDRHAAFERRVPKNRQEVPITQAMLGNEAILSNATDYIGQPVMASTRYIPELDWGLVAKINESEIHQLSSNDHFQIHLAELFIILTAIAAGFVIAFTISNPTSVQKHLSIKSKKNKRVAYDPMNQIAQVIKTQQEFQQHLKFKVDEHTDGLRKAIQKLEKLVNHDPLTGLLNRRALEQRLEAAFEHARQFRSNLTVAILGIDHFATIRDLQGHLKGNEIEKQIAEYLASAIQDAGVAAKIDEGQFCVILPNCAANASRVFLERLRVDLSKIDYSDSATTFKITCSIGVAFFNEQAESPSQLIDNANAALREARGHGKNQVVQFSAR